MPRRRWWEPNPETMLEDLLAVSAESRARRREAAAKSKATNAARREAKRQAGLNAAVARMPRRAKRVAKGLRYADRVLTAMEPGEWYGSGDVVRLAGLDRPARSKLWQDLRPARLVERAPNPAYDKAKEIFSVEREPRWLWRLTAAGEARRERLAAPTPAALLDRSEKGEQAIGHPLRDQRVD